MFCEGQVDGRNRARNGLVLIEVLLVLLFLIAISAGVFHLVHEKMLAKRCQANLRLIYSALEMYEIDRGTLPRLALFPDDPKQDRDGLLTVLSPYGVGDSCVCPELPASLRALGLTYVWNVQMNGKKLRGSQTPTWLLVEISALSDRVPAPHLGRYNILYSNGTIGQSINPPADFRPP